MRISIYIFALFLIPSISGSCTKNVTEAAPAQITVEHPEITLPENVDGPQTATVTFQATAPWEVETSDTKAVPEWIRVSPMRGDPGVVTLTIAADENDTPYGRTGYIRLHVGDLTRSISVIQPGNGTLPPGQSLFEMGPARDTILLKLKSGSAYSVNIPQGTTWVTSQSIAQGVKFDTLRLFLSPNITMDARTANLSLSDPKSGFKAALRIIQPSGALNLKLNLQKILLPTGAPGSDAATSWTDSLFVAGFDTQGNPLFTHSIPQVTDASLSFRVMPPENLIRSSYPGASVFVVANSSANISRWPGNMERFMNRKDTASTRLFSLVDDIMPPLSGQVRQELRPGDNTLGVNLSHVTAQVTFKVFFDSLWVNPPPIEKLSIGGFTSWGYLLTNKTDTLTAPRNKTFNPSVVPNKANEYVFFAYEKSLLVLNIRVGGRNYRGEAPDILKRGYKYTFNMRLCEDGKCHSSSGSGGHL